MQKINKSLVSIIVPVYNIKEYVEKCLQSLINQTYKDIEILVIDDGSTDGSSKICDKLALADDRIRVIHQSNKGLSGARNVGIEHARGNYICFVDGDDYVKKNFVEAMAREMTNEIQIVVCGYNDVIPKNEVLSGRDATLRLLTEQENIDIIAWNKMYEKHLFDNVRYPLGEKFEDNLTTYKLLNKAEKVSFISESLYKYIKRSDSIIGKSENRTRLLAREKAAKEAMEFFKNDKDLAEASMISFLTAKMAFIDFALSKKIDKKYYDENKNWIMNKKTILYNNRFLSTKLKTYIVLLSCFDGIGYKIFRKIKH